MALMMVLENISDDARYYKFGLGVGYVTERPTLQKFGLEVGYMTEHLVLQKFGLKVGYVAERPTL